MYKHMDMLSFRDANLLKFLVYSRIFRGSLEVSPSVESRMFVEGKIEKYESLVARGVIGLPARVAAI